MINAISKAKFSITFLKDPRVRLALCVWLLIACLSIFLASALAGS